MFTISAVSSMVSSSNKSYSSESINSTSRATARGSLLLRGGERGGRPRRREKSESLCTTATHAPTREEERDEFEEERTIKKGQQRRIIGNEMMTSMSTAAAFWMTTQNIAMANAAETFDDAEAAIATSNLGTTMMETTTSSSGNAGLESVRLVVAVSAIALILFQGPKGDGVVNKLSEKRVFSSAKNAKSAVDYVTYALIGGFIVLSAVLAVG
jgi:preprotein translocase subunit SecG